ncbi:MAG: hypothetical protein IJU92_09385 [Spirochaetaceae bacterium]|nr:hypothetical protein [Spirochaetaceae bacterium]
MWKHAFAIEIKSTSQTDTKASRNLKKYLELKGDKQTKGAIFYLGDISLKLNEIEYVFWKDWGAFVTKES